MSKQPDNKSDRILSKRDLFFAWFRYNMFGHVAQSIQTGFRAADSA